MKVAVSSSAKYLYSRIDQRFGRCAYFLMVETDDMSFEVFDNESAGLSGGAGIQSAQFVISKGAKVVITGNCGPNAVKTLSAAGVTVFLGITGTIKEAVEKYKSGNLVSADKGLGSGMETGRGMGMGRRLGRGGGR
ncbi:MAG: NifB/NifX family molybdenum-iron cluster-binding protein [Deltaproteobacteria bacterium]|nr:NifB/NifX family molybdenum-iron cluster-binding protein [Deltaproteobacteria bacterium]MBW2670068.1 NifB/NifX family molybdenum-iron cluster-binding protein [Deltaproteobacteria bacterium]